MNLTFLLGLPLDTALETARREGLRVDRVEMTSAGGGARKARESEDGFEKRVVACRGCVLIAASFRTAPPAEKTEKGTCQDE